MANEAQELPRFNRLVYASGSFGGNVIGRSKDLWLFYFYAGSATADVERRIPLLVLGALFTAARLIEALDDRWFSISETARPNSSVRWAPVTMSRRSTAGWSRRSCSTQTRWL